MHDVLLDFEFFALSLGLSEVVYIVEHKLNSEGPLWCLVPTEVE